MGSNALTYAIRARVLFKYLGQLFLVLIGLSSVPFLISIWFGDTSHTIRYALVIAVLGLCGGFLSRIHAPSRLQANEAMVLVCLIFVLGPLLMTYPMMSSGLAFDDALFEAVSAVTTTGLSTLLSIQNMPDTFLFARAWMQWYGGLGIVVFTLALIVQPGLTAKDLSVTESDPDDLVGSTKIHARRTLIVYGVLTTVGILTLFLTGTELFNSVILTFSAISTGGFAPVDTSLTQYRIMPQLLIGLLCIMGAIPLVFYRQLFLQKGKRGTSGIQIFLLILCGTITTALLALGMVNEGRLFSFELWRHAWFQAFAAQTSAGFSTVDISSLDTAAKLAMMPAMLIGGGIGSTTGGIKVFRMLLFFRFAYVVIVRTATPKHAVTYPTLGNRKLHDQEIQGSLLVILLFFLTVVLSWVPFVIMGYDPIDSLFEVISATGTVGLSTGITQSQLPVFLKGLLCVDMLLGRLEILAWLIVVYPRTWFGRRAETV